jgi:hypothetical protein
MVFLVMSKHDRLDEPAKVTCGAIKDLLKKIVPK